MAKVYTHDEKLTRAASILGKKHVISSLHEDGAIIAELAGKLSEQQILDDFSEGLEAKPEYANPVLVLSLVKETGRYRFILMPNSDAIMSVKAVVARAYEMLAASVFRNAKSPDVTAAKFQSAISAVLPKISEASFRVLAPRFLDFIASKAGKGASVYKNISTKLLRECLSSEAAAKSYFPKVPLKFWDDALDMLRAAATKNALDTLCFDNWAQGRKLVADTSAPAAELDLTSFGSTSLADEAAPASPVVAPPVAEMTDAELEAATAPTPTA